MDGSALQLTLRQVRGHLTDLRTLGIMAVIGIVLGFAGPFGTFETLPVTARVGYWLATVFLTYILGFGISMYVDRSWGRGRPMVQRGLIMLVPAGLGATIVMWLLNLAVFGTVSLTSDAILTLVAQCYAVAAAVVAVTLLTEPRVVPATTTAPSTARILDRLALPQRGALIALIVEDHYVDIVTERGKTLVLMRLADAMRETDGIPGLQIHRSHWVATAAVTKTHRKDGKVTLELSNGMQLPVSRGFLPAVKDAGLV